MEDEHRAEPEVSYVSIRNKRWRCTTSADGVGCRYERVGGHSERRDEPEAPILERDPGGHSALHDHEDSGHGGDRY